MLIYVTLAISLQLHEVLIRSPYMVIFNCIMYILLRNSNPSQLETREVEVDEEDFNQPLALANITQNF